MIPVIILTVIALCVIAEAICEHAGRRRRDRMIGKKEYDINDL